MRPLWVIYSMPKAVVQNGDRILSRRWTIGDAAVRHCRLDG